MFFSPFQFCFHITINMKGLEERWYGYYKDDRTDSSKPTIEEIFQWSEIWAQRLFLWGVTEPGDLDYFDSSGWVLHLGSSREQQKPPVSEQECAEFENFSLRSVRAYPQVRREANDIADRMLKDSGATDDEIATFKQVLPYKLAHLHHIRNPKPKVRTVTLWIYKKNLHLFNMVDPKLDLLHITLNVELSYYDVLAKLHRRSNPKNYDDAPRGIPWEYILVEGDEPHMSEEKSDGIIEDRYGWESLLRTMLRNDTPYTSAILFQVSNYLTVSYSTNTIQRSEMHKSHKIAPIDIALGIAKRPEDPPPINWNEDPKPGDFDYDEKLEAAVQEAKDLGIWEKLFPPKNGVGSSSSATPVENSKAEDDQGYHSDDDDEYSEYVKVWLEHDDVIDEYFEFPRVPVRAWQPTPGSTWRTWYFQPVRE
jgi:hypothetical protein